MTHPAATPRHNAYLEILDTSDTREVKPNMRPTRHVSLKRRMSVPAVARDGHNWDVKSELSVESD